MNNHDRTNEERRQIPDGLLDHLHPDLIYRFNQMFIPAWKQGGIGYIDAKKTAFFTLSYFNSHTRTFNWVSIGIDIWAPRSDDSEKAVQKLKKILNQWNGCEDTEFTTETYCERKKAWKTLWKDFPEGGIYNYARRICKDLKFSESSEDHRAMLGLYSGFHFQEEMNIEGVFVRYQKALAEKKEMSEEERTAYLKGTLVNLPKDDQEAQKPPFDWFVLDAEDVLKRYQNTRDPKPCSSFSCEQEALEALDEDQVPPKAEGIQELSEKFFEQLLSKPGDLGKQLAKRPNILLIPIYEVWLEDTLAADASTPRDKADIRGFGRIKAVILTFFEAPNKWDNKAPDKRDKWIEEKLPILCNQLPRMASTIIEASKTQALSQPIKPPYDLLRHFIKILVYIQDWERAYVVDTNKNEVLFYYKREKKSDSPIVDWKEGCLDGSEINGITLPCDPSTIQCKDGKRFMWWTCDLWSEKLIHSLGDEEHKAFSNFAICFEFPKACYIPAETDLKKRMRNVYMRQQLDLMNLLIPRVQRRRAALRSAVSAIMGRNMSHNIGSHVIARYAAVADDLKEQRGEGLELERGEIDHRTVFFQYLQKRMDFIAEVSTSDKPNWSQPLGLVEVLDALNFKKEKERINKTTSTVFDPEPILLSYITGKKGIKASVCIDKTTKEYFNCPSGDVGAHALYVILENIIRNSARHNTNLGSEVKLKVEVIDSDDPELLKLEITDCQTEELEIRVSGKCKPLDEHINNIIQTEPFLNEDGSPNPQYWGIREMQICAQHLRGLPLSELETPLPPAEEIDDASRVLKAFIKQEEKNGKSRLVYRLYLQRAKLCAIVADWKQSSELYKKREKFKEMGISLHQEVPDDAADYSFLVLPKSKSAEEKEKSNIKWPIRTLYTDIDKELLEKVDTSSDPRPLLEPLHKNICQYYLKKQDEYQGIMAFIGWQNFFASEVMKKGVFRHMSKNDLNNDINNIREFLDEEKLRGMMWFDHATPQDFEAVNCSPSIIFGETLDSSSPHKSMLEATQTEHEYTGNELIAAALGRVIVLDERVQNEKEKKYREIYYKKLWPCMGIEVPSETNLNNPNFDEIQPFIQNSSAEFLVLHLTILESLTKQRSFNSEHDTLNELMDGIEDCEVIIVTGRGVPSNSNQLQVRYLPISALLEYLISRPSKLALMRALWHANVPR